MEGELVWLVMARARGVGRARLATLMDACPNPADAWCLTESDLARLDSWNPHVAMSAAATRRDRKALAAAAAQLTKARKAGLRLVALPDPDYPFRLRQTPDPPAFFYRAGPWVPDDRPAVAIVGTRKPTPYGLALAERFGYELAQAGALVVSGMARGIDCAAHRGAIAAGGTTIAVLGGGADVCYPREAQLLYKQIRASGAVLSEQPPGTPPKAEYFPERNRIISGLSQGVVVVEAGEQSGTLLTVSSALRQGRDVFAVPGPVTSPMSAGPHALIRDGACLVSNAREVLEELGFGQPEQASRASLAGLSPEERQIVGWMGSEPRWAGDLARACGLTPQAVQGALTGLELKGLVRKLAGGQYVRVG